MSIHSCWGELSNPAHKSDLNQLTGEHSCSRRLGFDLEARAGGQFSDDRRVVSGKAAAGTATHEVIRRVLQRPESMEAAQAGGAPERNSLSKALWREWDRATQGREVRWGKSDSTSRVLANCEEMLVGLLGELHEYVAEVVLAEAGFIAPLGGNWIEGHVDLVYRPTSDPSALAITDWKTGSKVPHQHTLDQGWESGLYSAALRDGVFVPEQLAREYHRAAQELPEAADSIHAAPNQRERMHAILRAVGRRLEAGRPLPSFCVQFGQFPREVWLTHLMDYVPYSRKASKSVSRPEELAFFGMQAPGKVSRDQGERRGPAWYRVRRTEADVPRLVHLLSTAVTGVRSGLLLPSVGEQCSRCPFREDCFAEGYDLAEGLEDLGGVLNALHANDDGGLGAAEGI